jgi:hypothetical protein
MPFIGYLLSTKSAISTIAGYHELNSDFGGIPLLALPWSFMKNTEK